MIIRRTGVNEPPLAKDLLKEKGIEVEGMANLSPSELIDWQSSTDSRLLWVMFGELEVVVESATGSLIAGDLVMFEPGERFQIKAGNSGCGYIQGQSSVPLPDRI